MLHRVVQNILIQSVILVSITGLALANSGTVEPQGKGCLGILTSMANAKEMFDARGTERDKVFVEVPHYIRIRAGMPATLRLVSPQGKVFRHYTSKQGLQRILESKTLQAGWTPFYYSGYISDYNEDLNGIFITTPDVEPRSIGVRPENAAFVDFKLNEGTGILFLREGIFLIPGSPRAEGWKENLYQSENRGLHQSYAEEFARWDQEGIPQPLEIPIEIIDSKF